MTDQRKVVRLSKAAKEFNVGRDTIIDFLLDKGFEIDRNPNTKLAPEMYNALLEEFQEEKHVREIAQQKELEYLGKDTITIEDKKAAKVEPKDEIDDFEPADELIIKNVGVDYSAKESTPKKKATKETSKKEAEEKKEEKIDKDDVKDEEKEDTGGIKVLDKIDLDSLNQKTRPKRKTKEEKEKEKEAKTTKKKAEKETKTVEKEPEVAETKPEIPEEKVEAAVEEEKKKPAKKTENEEEDNFIPTKFEKLTGPTVVDKIELPKEVSKPKKEKKPVASSDDKPAQKKKRKRIKTQPDIKQEAKRDPKKKTFGKRKEAKPEPTEEEIQQRIKETLARLAPSGKSKSSKYRRQKRDSVSQSMQDELSRQEQEKSVLKVTEFLTANELAIMMNVSVNEIIKSCMQLGLFVSINQRLDAETIVLVAEEFGYQVEFVSIDDSESLEVEEIEDDPKDLVERAPIVTVMDTLTTVKQSFLITLEKRMLLQVKLVVLLSISGLMR